MELVFSRVLNAVKEKGYLVSDETDDSFQIRKGEEQILCRFEETRIRFYVIVRNSEYEYLAISYENKLDSIFHCIDGTIHKSMEFKQTLF